MALRAPIVTFKRARKLRRAMTLPEVILWENLRGEKLARLRFRRQHPVGPFILDFYCSSARLCVEVDGMAHDFASTAAHDERRTAWLMARGIRVHRVMARDVLDNELLDGVLESIARAAAPSTGFAGPPPP